jgi:hypothetical protein
MTEYSKEYWVNYFRNKLPSDLQGREIEISNKNIDILNKYGTTRVDTAHKDGLIKVT